MSCLLKIPSIKRQIRISIYTKDNSLATRGLRHKAIADLQDRIGMFLKAIELRSSDPSGEILLDARLFTFHIQYPSCITGKEEDIKIDIDLDHNPLQKLSYYMVKHPYQDLLTGQDLILSVRVLSLSYKRWLINWRLVFFVP